MHKIGIECESIEDQSWGVGRIVKKLLEEISKRPELQKEFKFFLYFKSKIPDLPCLADPIFVKKIVKLPWVRPSFSLYYYLLLPIKLYFEKLDLMYFPNYMLPIIFKGRSLVTLTEDVYYEFNSGTLPFRYKLAYKIFANWAAKHAAKIMAISETSKKEVSKLFKINPDRIFVNQLGVDIPKPITYNLKPKTYILYVGQTFPRRHLKETMLAFEKLAPEFPGLELIAVGQDKYSPPIIENLKNEINEHLGREAITYKNYVSEDELINLYRHAKLLVYISSKEAFGLPPLEALSYGVPPVIADQAIAREIFGSNAFFAANPDDPHSIAKVITEGLTNAEKREEVRNSAGQILKKYTWPAHTDRFIKAIKTVL
jgi:glycosyltransferase involved in cell wall biosynthesis